MRHWKSLTTSFTTLCARISLTASIFIINGVAARRMSHDQFGLWTILFSVNLLTNALDFGFCFTLGNRLAALSSLGADAEEERRETFLSVFFLQLVLAVGWALLIYVGFPHLPWMHWLKVTDPTLIREVQPCMSVLLMLMVSTLPVSLMWTVFYAYQEIKLASYLGAAGSLLQTIIFVLAALRLKFMPVMLIYFSWAIVAGAILTSYVFIRRKWQFTLLPLGRILRILASMRKVSLHAFIQALAPVTSQVLGTIFSGYTGGLTAAGDFTLIQKLFSFMITSHLAILAPVSPSVARDAHAGDWEAIRRRLRICVFQLWPLAFLTLGPMIWFAHPWLIRLWAGHALKMYPLAGLLLAWACLVGFVNTFSVFLNSLGLVKVQAAMSFAIIVPSLLLPVVLSHWFGLAGIALSMVVCALPATIAWPLYTRRALRLRLRRV